MLAQVSCSHTPAKPPLTEFNTWYHQLRKPVLPPTMLLPTAGFLHMLSLPHCTSLPPYAVSELTKARLSDGASSLVEFEVWYFMPTSRLFLKVHIIYVSNIFKNGLWFTVSWRHPYQFTDVSLHEPKSLCWKGTCLKQVRVYNNICDLFCKHWQGFCFCSFVWFGVISELLMRKSCYYILIIVDL